jgi:polysaccharide pyruvyl transferase WcaK-like protein
MLRKVLITGASTYGVKNHGDDAMLATLVQSFQDIHNDLDITFLCRHPNEEYDELFNFKSIKNVDHDSSSSAKERIFNGFNKGDNNEHIQKIVHEITESSLVVIGGNSLMEIASNDFLRGVSSYSTLIAIWCITFNKPYVLYGLNIVNPLYGKTTIQHAKFLVENATMVTAREDHVIGYLKEHKIDTDNVKVYGDPAFGIKTTNKIDLLSVLGKEYEYWRDNEKFIFGFNYRIEYWDSSKEDREIIFKKLANVIEFLIESQNAQFIFIPNCTYQAGNPWQDDRLTNREILKFINLNARKSIFLIEQELDIFSTIEVFSTFNHHITNRRHSAIFAALKGLAFSLYRVGFKSHISPLISELDIDTLCIDESLDASCQINSILKDISNSKKNIQRSNKSLIKLIEYGKQQAIDIAHLI